MRRSSLRPRHPRRLQFLGAAGRVAMPPTSFLLGLVLLCGCITRLEAVPLPKLSFNATTNLTRRAGSPGGRQARLFGKFSMVAGVGLPELGASPAIADRQDVLIESQPKPLVTSYNFPPTNWGPYFAAVYEPSISLFFKNPLKYLASVFNPFKWLDAKASAAAASTESPTTLAIVAEQDSQDNVVILVPGRENEAASEDRKLASDKLEMDRMRKKRKKVISKVEAYAPEDATPMKKDGELDLLAEETTTKPVALSEEDEEEADQESAEAITSTTKRPRRTRRTTKRRTSKTATTSDVMPTNATDQPTSASPYPTYHPPPTYLPPPLYTPPPYYPGYYPPQPSYGPPRPTYSPAQSTYSPPPSYTRPSYPSPSGAAYYHGYPQNVSHLEFTTTASGFRPEPAQRFADVNSLPHQVSFDAFDSSGFRRDPSVFDYYSLSEQLPPERRDFKEFLPNNGNHLLNDFKPSYPFQIIL